MWLSSHSQHLSLDRHKFKLQAERLRISSFTYTFNLISVFKNEFCISGLCQTILRCTYRHWHFFSFFQDDAEFKKARGAELEYESLKVSSQSKGKLDISTSSLTLSKERLIWSQTTCVKVLYTTASERLISISLLWLWHKTPTFATVTS